jgi:hypothetical protein
MIISSPTKETMFKVLNIMNKGWVKFFDNLAVEVTANSAQLGLGVSGSFTTADSKTVTVTNGIITGIV